MHKIVVTGLAISIAAVAPAVAQDPGSRQTREFLATAAQLDQFEILEARTALTGSRNPEILTFARLMIRDHERTSQALRDAAVRSGLKPPEMALGDDQAHLLSALQGLTGPQFDKTYAKQQLLTHRSTLAAEQLYAASGDDPNVRKAAVSTVPLIQAHAAMAEKLAAKFSGS